MAHGAFSAELVVVKKAKVAHGVIGAERIVDLVVTVVSAVRETVALEARVVSAALPLLGGQVVLAVPGKRWTRQTWKNLRQCAKPSRL